MSDLVLHRLIDLLNALVQQCNSIRPIDGAAPSDSSLVARVNDWFHSPGLLTTEAMEEAASLCEQLGLEGAAGKLREDSGKLLKDWTDICFHDLAADRSTDEIVFMQQTYGHFPLPLEDSTREEEVNRDRRAIVYGQILMLGEYAHSLLQSIQQSPEAHHAHRERLFPKGVPDDPDLVDAIIRLDTERKSDNRDMDILRKFTSESKGECPKAKSLQGRIRKARQDGKTTLSTR